MQITSDERTPIMKKFALVAVALAFTSLTPAWADGGPPSANYDKGGISSNPDKGGTAAKPDGGSGPAPVATLAAKSSASTSGNVQSPSGYVHVPTLVEQLTAKLAYQQANAVPPANGQTGNYAYYASKRTAKQLAAANLAQQANTPLPPILGENGVPVPVSTYAHTYYGDDDDEITALY
jgi:hypothetical protein